MFSYLCGWVILFYNRNGHTLDTTGNKGNSFQFQRKKTFGAVAEKVHLSVVQ